MCERERERDRERERQRDRDRETERDRETDRDRQRQTERESAGVHETILYPQLSSIQQPVANINAIFHHIKGGVA